MTALDMKGIETRHRNGCTAKQRLDCPCGPTYRVTLDIDNERVRRNFTNPADAVQFRTDAGRARYEGRYVAPNMVPLREHWQGVLEGMKCGAVRKSGGGLYKPQTIATYALNWRVHLDSALGALTPTDPGLVGSLKALVATWTDPRHGKVLEPSTIKNALMPLRILFRHLIYHEKATTDPVRAISAFLPSGETPRDNVVDWTQLADMLSVLDPFPRALYALAGYGGLRIGEIRGLQEELIDWDALEIHVDWQYCLEAKGLILPKGGKTRVVPIMPALYEALQPWRQMRRSRPTSRWFLPSIHGGPFSYEGIQKAAVRAWTNACLPTVTPHNLRHCFVSYAAHAGIPAAVIGEIVSHKNLETTARYTHLFKHSLRDAADQMHEHFNTPD